MIAVEEHFRRPCLRILHRSKVLWGGGGQFDPDMSQDPPKRYIYLDQAFVKEACSPLLPEPAPGLPKLPERPPPKPPAPPVGEFQSWDPY